MNRACFSLFATAFLLLPLTASASDPKTPSSTEKLTPQTKLLIMRDLTAERVFVRTPLPMGERGLAIKDGKVSPSEAQVAALVMQHGFAAKPGDRVVITNVLIKETSIVIEINGGGKKHEKWYQHVELGANGTTAPVGGAPKSLSQGLERYARVRQIRARAYGGASARHAGSGVRLQGAEPSRGLSEDLASEGSRSDKEP